MTRNTYYALRHGTSLANERGIVVSTAAHGVAEWGLSPAGVAACRQLFSDAAWACPPFTAADTLVLTSDFRRARETADLLCELLGLAPARIEVGLRERNFGGLELGSAKHYDDVWSRDERQPNHGFAGSETTDSVAQRMLAVVERVESTESGKRVVLVSHGDPLQILETVLRGLPSYAHRRVPHLGNAELRRLVVAHGTAGIAG